MINATKHFALNALTNQYWIYKVNCISDCQHRVDKTATTMHSNVANSNEHVSVFSRAKRDRERELRCWLLVLDDRCCSHIQLFALFFIINQSGWSAWFACGAAVYCCELMNFEIPSHRMRAHCVPYHKCLNVSIASRPSVHPCVCECAWVLRHCPVWQAFDCTAIRQLNDSSLVAVVVPVFAIDNICIMVFWMQLEIY